MEQKKDEKLLRIAKARVEFRRHLAIYIIINGFLVSLNIIYSPMFFWAAFPLFFWGIGLLSHYRDAYSGGFEEAVEREYRKLKKQGKR